jgi:TetR/AcrR family transcriptional regulator, regulator of cefoperazone and chloramphenicol sensitivity
MKIPRQDTARTRGSLLKTASEVFAEKGYRDTTIAEISERAGTNIAAVNYHFGDKEALYREAWRYSFLQSLEAHPPDGGAPDNAPVEHRLKAQIRALLSRSTDPNNKGFMIVNKELANPTGLLEEVMREEVLPITERMEGLVREVLGPGAPRTEVRFCTVAIIGQCIMPTYIGRLETTKPGPRKDSWRIDDIEAYAGHIAAFSLAGMRAVCRAAQEVRVTGKAPVKKSGRVPTISGRPKIPASSAGKQRSK